MELDMHMAQYAKFYYFSVSLVYHIHYYTIDFYKTLVGYGHNHDPSIPTEIIKIYYCDQTNTDAIKTMWSNLDLVAQFDIILDDGLHTFLQMPVFFENSIHTLKKDGYYIIKEINSTEFLYSTSKIVEWEIIYPSLRSQVAGTCLIIIYLS